MQPKSCATLPSMSIPAADDILLRANARHSGFRRYGSGVMRLEHDPVNIWCRRQDDGWSWSVEGFAPWFGDNLTGEADTFTKAASAALLALFDATVPKSWKRDAALVLFTGESTFALYMAAIRGHYALGPIGVELAIDEYIEERRPILFSGRYTKEGQPEKFDEFCILTRELIATLEAT